MEIRSTAVSSGTHVVLMPYPSAGHSGPFVHFAKHLARSGVAVSFMAPDSEVSSLNHLLEIDADDSRHMITVVPFAFPIHREAMDTAFFFYIRNWMQSHSDTFHDIVARLVHSDAGPPACIISDMFLGFTQGIADKLGIRRYCLYSSPAHFLSFTFHFPQFYSEGRLPATSWEEPTFRIPNFPPIPTGDLPPSLHTVSNAPNTFFLEESKPLWRAAGVIVNSVHELEAPVIEGLRKFLADNSPLNQAPTIMTMGPVLEGLWEGEDSTCSFRERIRASIRPRDACFDWLDQQPDVSVLYVCYGSIARPSAAQVLELAMGLENSGQRFLWVLRTPMKGLEVLPEGFLERTKARGWVYTDWAPQLHILAHRAVGGFLSHCGWNSATESMCMGVPMVAMPVQGDQMLNATLIANVLKVGIRINDNIGAWFQTVHRDTIAAAVRVVMSDDEMRRKAAQVSATIQRTVRPGGSSRENLSLLVQYLKSLRPSPGTSSAANSMA